MADPTLLVPGNGAKNMEPLWNKGNAAIRTVDPTTIVFFEGSTYDIFSGFNNVPSGDGSKTAQRYHYYNPPQLGKIQDTLANRIKDATLLKTTGMLTEFHFWDEGAEGRAGILNTAWFADVYMQSWQGWAYENLWDSTTLQPIPELARIYARTYAEATAGATKTLHFQDETSKYWVSWVADTSIAAPGLIRISPQIYYPDGIRVFFVPAGSGTYTMDGTNIVQLHYTAAAQNGQTIRASVQPFFPTDIIKNPASGKCFDNGNNSVTPVSDSIFCSSIVAPERRGSYRLLINKYSHFSFLVPPTRTTQLSSGPAPRPPTRSGSSRTEPSRWRLISAARATPTAWTSWATPRLRPRRLS